MSHSIEENNLIFDVNFNQPLDDFKFPDSLQSIIFGYIIITFSISFT